MSSWPHVRTTLTYTDPMALLALDGSTEVLCVAVLPLDGRPAMHEQFAGGAQASAGLLPGMAALMRRAGVDWADVQGVACGHGPGAFTGLRTACAAAQGWCLARGVPAVAVPSLGLVAQQARAAQADPEAPLDVAVAVDARMGQVYAQAWSWDGTRWQARAAPSLHEGNDAGRPGDDGVALRAGNGWPQADVSAGMDGRSAALAWWALHAWMQGPRLDAAALMPLYVRDRVALTTAERRAQGGLR